LLGSKKLVNYEEKILFFGGKMSIIFGSDKLFEAVGQTGFSDLNGVIFLADSLTNQIQKLLPLKRVELRPNENWLQFFGKKMMRRH